MSSWELKSVDVKDRQPQWLRDGDQNSQLNKVVEKLVEDAEIDNPDVYFRETNGLSSAVVLIVELTTPAENKRPRYVVRFYPLCRDLACLACSTTQENLKCTRVASDGKLYADLLKALNQDTKILPVIVNLPNSTRATAYRYFPYENDHTELSIFKALLEPNKTKTVPIQDFARAIATAYTSQKPRCPEVFAYHLLTQIGTALPPELWIDCTDECEVIETQTSDAGEVKKYDAIIQAIGKAHEDQEITFSLTVKSVRAIADDKWLVRFDDGRSYEVWLSVNCKNFAEHAKNELLQTRERLPLRFKCKKRIIKTLSQYGEQLGHSPKSLLFVNEMLVAFNEKRGSLQSVSTVMRHSDLHVGNVLVKEETDSYWLKVIDIGDARMNLAWADAATLEISLWNSVPNDAGLVAEDIRKALKELEVTSLSGYNTGVSQEEINATLNKLKKASYDIRRGAYLGMADIPGVSHLERHLAYAMAAMAQQRYDLLDHIAGHDKTRNMVVRNALAEYYTGLVRRELVYAFLPETEISEANAPNGQILSKSDINLKPFDDYNKLRRCLPDTNQHHGLPISLHQLRELISGRQQRTTEDRLVVIHGESGSGKSSLVKAALDHLLKTHDKVETIFISAEAVQDETIESIKTTLCKKANLNGATRGGCTCEKLSQCVNRLHDLQRSESVPEGTVPHQKIVIIVDQFEQWLQGVDPDSYDKNELVAAIKATDSDLVQWVVIVREEYLASTYALLEHLEIERIENQTTFHVRALNKIEAEGILNTFAIALSEESENQVPDTTVLRQIVDALSERGYVRPVHLVVFALTHPKPATWSDASVAQSATENFSARIGKEYLKQCVNEICSSDNASSIQKVLLRRVLEALQGYNSLALGPETQVKGKRQSVAQLVENIDESDSTEIAKLLRILKDKSIVRDITELETGDLSYELTHDYLVEAIRLWATEEKLTTQRGKDELTLDRCYRAFEGSSGVKVYPGLEEWRQIRELYFKNGDESLPKDLKDTVKNFVDLCDSKHLVKERERINKEISEKFFDTLLETKDYWQELAAIGSQNDLFSKLVKTCLNEKETSGKAVIKSLVAQLVKLHPSVLLGYLSILKKDTQNQAEFIKVVNGYINAHGDGFQAVRIRSHFLEFAFLAFGWITEINDDNFKAFVNDLIRSSEDKLGDWISSMIRLGEGGFNAAEKLALARQIRPAVLEAIGNRNVKVLNETSRADAVQLFCDVIASEPSDFEEAFAVADQKQFLSLYSELTKERQFNETALLNFMNTLDLQLRPKHVSYSLDVFEHPEKFDVPVTSEKKKEKYDCVCVEKDKRNNEIRQDSNMLVLRSMLIADFVSDKDRIGRLESVLAYVLPRSKDEQLRSFVLDRLATFGFSLEIACVCLTKELALTVEHPNADVAQFWALFIGLCDGRVFTSKEQDHCNKLLDLALIRIELMEDPGLHSALEWMLAKHGRKFPTAGSSAKWRYYEGMKFIRIKRNDEFTVGGPWYEDYDSEAQRPAMPTPVKEFWISATHVTWEFLGKSHSIHGIDPWQSEILSPTQSTPATYMNWHEVGKFCNALSEKCNIPVEEFSFSLNKTEKARVKKVGGDYLKKQGFRTPTEVEMEYVMRAGTVTTYPHGDSVELLVKYANYSASGRNHMTEVGALMPNAWGLFDVSGNVYAWCLDVKRERYWNKKDARPIPENFSDLRKTKERAIRGGAYFDPYTELGPGYRYAQDQDVRKVFIGIRLARSRWD